MTALVIDLFAGADAALVGAKAAALARAHAAGHPVPDGCVVTVAGCEAEGAGREEVLAALARQLARLGPGPFAVRSSAVHEDGALRSWAGQLASELSVAGDDVPAAVRRCAASARALGALGYAGRRSGDGPGATAIVVQRMVPASAAGVAFSADPRTGQRGVALVEAVAGLGDALVSGRADPEVWRAQAGEATRVRGPAAVLSPGQVEGVVALCRSMEELFGAPQDIEWALAGDALFLLQSRPITALPAAPVPIHDEPPSGDWERDDHNDVMSPLGWAVFQPYPKEMARLMRELGMPVKALELRRYRGHLYRRMVMSGGSGKPPPRWVLWLLMRLLPSARRGERRVRELLEDERYLELQERWERDERPAMMRALAALAAPDRERLSDDELLAHLGACQALTARGLELHCELGAAELFGVGKLMLFVVDRLGWPAQRTYELLVGRSPATTELHQRVGRLVREHRTGLAPGAPRSWAELWRCSPALGAELRRVLDEERFRVLNYDPKNETLGERPDLLLSIVQAAIAAEALPPEVDFAAQRREAALAEAKTRLAATDAAELERLVALAGDAYAVRDANSAWCVSKPAGVLRSFVLELGRRVEAAIGRREHAVYLLPEEHAPALRGQLPGLGALIEHRRGEESWAHFNRGPPRFGAERPPMPPLAAFPRGLRQLMRIFDLYERLEAPPRRADDGVALSGVGLGQRTVVARARVIRHAGELDSLRFGEALVCRISSPEWSLALGRAGAIVTDEGGSLSHPAIIAREFGITAVLGTEYATRRIDTGDTLRVDPVAGTVEVLR